MASGFSSSQTSEHSHLFLIGKTGNGKSATGNTILQKRVFKSMSQTESVTIQLQRETGRYEDRKISVVDGPGVGDTRMSDEDAIRLLQSKFEEAMNINPGGYHAFLIVVRYGGRFTEEDSQTIRCLKQIFGKDFVRKFCILLLTCGDNFEDHQEEHGMSFDTWCRAQTGVFKDLVRECNSRIVLFDNATKAAEKKKEQMGNLCKLVDSLKGVRYTREDFDDAKRSRQRQLIKTKAPQIFDDTLTMIDLLEQDLTRTKREQYEKQPIDLGRIHKRADRLFISVSKQDMGTGILTDALSVTSDFIDRIQSHAQFCEMMIKEKKLSEEREQRLKKENEERLEKERQERDRRLREKLRQEEKLEQERKELAKKLDREQKERERKRQKMLEELREEMEREMKEEEERFKEQMKLKEERRERERARRRKEEEREREERLRQIQRLRRTSTNSEEGSDSGSVALNMGLLTTALFFNALKPLVGLLSNDSSSDSDSD